MSERERKREREKINHQASQQMMEPLNHRLHTECSHVHKAENIVTEREF